MLLTRLENLTHIMQSNAWHEIIAQFIREYPSILDKKEASYPLCHGAFYNVMEAQLKPNNAYEYHKKYIDIHCTVSGVEKIDGAFFSLFLGTGNFSEEKDAGFFENVDEKDCSFYIEPGNCAIFFPYEVHKALLMDDRANATYQKVKKAIIKIPYELWQKA